MILVQGQTQYCKAERLVSELTTEVLDWIEKLEASGYVFVLTNLPSHIKTHEVYAAILLDQFLDVYLPETEKLN